MASSGEPLFACWVQKQGGMIKTWKQRYLVLRADGLAYYESDKSSNPKGTVQLSSIEVGPACIHLSLPPFAPRPGLVIPALYC